MDFDTVIMYLRKSREDIEREKQTGEDTLQAHRERLTSLLISKGINKWVERAEVKTGDTIAGRPMFQKVLNEDIPSASGKVAICVTEISRLGRGDMEDAGKIYKTIVNYNVWIITPHKEYDPRNQADLRHIRFELFLSREEYEMIKERLWMARDERGKNGYAANYIVTLGFGTNRGKIFEIPEESRIVREIFEMRTEGKSYYEIACELNARGMKTKRGTKYHHSTIRRILHNPRYIGKARWRNQYYESKGPSIIPLELWNRVHQIVQPTRTVQRRAPKEDNPYLVTLFCHECGNRMYGEHQKSRRTMKAGYVRIYNEYDIYVCVGRKKANPRCIHRQRIDYIHEHVFDELNNIKTSTEIIEQLIQERNEKLLYGAASLKERIAFKKREIKGKETFLEKCKQDYKKGELAAPLYTELYEETIKEIGVLNSELRELKKRYERATIKVDKPEDIILYLDNMLKNWSRIKNYDKRKIIAAFLPKISVSKTGKLYFTRFLPVSKP